MLGERHVGANGVLYVHVVPEKRAVAPDDWAFTPDEAPNGARNQSTPVQVPAAVDIPESRDGHRQVVGAMVGQSEEVRAALGHLVGMAARERHVLRVGQGRLLTIRLVTRSEDDAVDESLVKP